jgi:nitrogen fixation protein FixH
MDRPGGARHVFWNSLRGQRRARYYALSTFSGEQEASPYEHGLAYDRDIESARQQDARGWNVALGVQRAEPGAPASIAVGIRDANNEALAGLEVSAGLEFPAGAR